MFSNLCHKQKVKLEKLRAKYIPTLTPLASMNEIQFHVINLKDVFKCLAHTAAMPDFCNTYLSSTDHSHTSFQGLEGSFPYPLTFNRGHRECSQKSLGNSLPEGREQPPLFMRESLAPIYTFASILLMLTSRLLLPLIKSRIWFIIPMTRLDVASLMKIWSLNTVQFQFSTNPANFQMDEIL